MSLANTVLLEYRKKYMRGGYDEYEHRATLAGAYEAYRKSNLTPGLQQELMNKKSQAQSVKVPSLTGGTVTIGSARSLTIADTAITSAYATLSWATIRSAFRMSPAINFSNEISYQDELFRKLDDLDLAWLDALDALAAANLNTNKTGFITADGNPYTLTSDEIIVPYTERENFFNEIDHIFKADKLPTMNMSIIGNTRMQPLFKSISEFAVYNSQNKIARLGNKELLISSNIAAETDYQYVGYAVAPNALGFYNWNDPDAQLRSKAYNGEVMLFTLPRTGLTVAAFYVSAFADNSSSLTGGERSLVEYWEFSTDISWLTAFNSSPTTKADPIMKFKIEKEETN